MEGSGLRFYFKMLYLKKKVKCSGYRHCVAQRVGKGSALLFHDRGTRRGWVVSSTPRPHFTPGKDPVPIVKEAVWAPRPVWTGGKSRPHRDSIPDRPAPSSVAIPTELPGPHMLCLFILIATRGFKINHRIHAKLRNAVLETHTYFCNVCRIP